MKNLYHYICAALFLLLLAPCSLEAAWRHLFHVSTFDMNYKASHKTLQITGHIFIDDLESAFQRRGVARPLRIGTQREDAQTNELIANYLKETMTLVANDQTLRINYLGKENSEDMAAIWVFMEVSNVTAPVKKISVKNSLLTEVFEDQKNIINLQISDRQKGSFLLSRYQIEDSVVF